MSDFKYFRLIAVLRQLVAVYGGNKGKAIAALQQGHMLTKAEIAYIVKGAL